MLVSFDVETTYHTGNLPWKPDARLISFALATDNGEVKSWLFDHPDCKQTQRDVIDEIKSYFRRATKIVGHNLKFDLHWLRYLGIDYSSPSLYCTMVAEYTLSGQTATGSLSLDDVSQQYKIASKIDKVKLYWESGYETDEIPAHILLPYNEQDCINALAIYQRQVGRIKELGMETLVSLEMETVRVLEDMEWNGMLLHTDDLSTHAVEYGNRIEEIDEELSTRLSIHNPGSPAQLSAGLFGGTYQIDGVEETQRKLKSGEIKYGTRKCKVDYHVEGVGFIPQPEWETAKQGVYSTSVANVLPNLKCKNKLQRQIKELLIERSRADQLKKMYFDGFLERSEDDGRIHPNLNNTITKTGRLSSSNPKHIGVVKLCEFRGTLRAAA